MCGTMLAAVKLVAGFGTCAKRVFSTSMTASQAIVSLTVDNISGEEIQ
jgi:hypothetical protein